MLTNLDFNGQEKYEVKGEALSDADVIKYITRVKETELFANVVLERSSLAQPMNSHEAVKNEKKKRIFQTHFKSQILSHLLQRHHFLPLLLSMTD